jgi:hypothetical protein
MPESIGLAEFVDQIKRELMRMPDAADSKESQGKRADGEDAAIRLLMLEEVELQIQVAVSHQGNAGLNIQVLQIGGSAKQDNTHTVKVKLQPLLSHDERIKELQRDPRWSQYVSAAVEYTVKGMDANSQLGT